MTIHDARAHIEAAVLAWPECSVHPHPFNAIQFRYGASRDLGHLHGNSLLDIPFPTKIRDELIASGLAEPHHVVADSDWVSFRIRQEADVDAALALLRRSYDIAAQQPSTPEAAP